MYAYDLLPPIVPDSIPPSTTGKFTIPITVYGNITDNTITTLADLEIQTIQIAIVNQDNNKPSINFIEGENVKYNTKTKTFDLKITSKILPTDNKEKNQFYKVQLRWSNKKDNKNAKYFSEWSSVCLIRYIKPIILDIFLGDLELNQVYKKDLDTNIIPDFYTSIKGNISSNTTQILKNYQIILKRKNNTTKKYSEYLKTDFLPPTATNKFIYELKKSFMQGESYQLIINASTSSGYKIEPQVYYFTIINDIVESDNFLCQSEVNDVQGAIDIHIIGQNNLKRNFLIQRASSEDNFSTWTKMAIIQFDDSQQKYKTIEVYADKNNEENFPSYKYFTWSDKTIKSGIFYKYSVAILYKAINKDIYLTGNHKEAGDPKTCIFEDMYLIDKDKTLKLRYNPEINNFKYNVSESIQTTLGSKYPFVNRTGQSNYRSFQIGGLITSFMDSDQRSFVPPTLYHSNTSSIQTQTAKKIYLEQNKYNKVKTLFSDFVVGPDDNLSTKGETTSPIDNEPNLTTIDLLQSDGSIKKYEAKSSDIVVYKNKNNYYLKYIFQDNRWKQIVNNISELKSFISSEQLFSKATLEYRRTYNTQNNINQYNDIIYEREFREAVYKFLNNPNLKLFKSSQQGNLLIRLTNLNFSPLKQLGRQLYSFTADAIEIDECNIDNLYKYKIYQIGNWELLSNINKATYTNTNSKTISTKKELKKLYLPDALKNKNNEFLYYTSIKIGGVNHEIAVQRNGTNQEITIKENGLNLTNIQYTNFQFRPNQETEIKSVQYSYKYISNPVKISLNSINEKIIKELKKDDDILKFINSETTSHLSSFNFSKQQINIYSSLSESQKNKNGLTYIFLYFKCKSKSGETTYQIIDTTSTNIINSNNYTEIIYQGICIPSSNFSIQSSWGQFELKTIVNKNYYVLNNEDKNKNTIANVAITYFTRPDWSKFNFF